MKRKLVLIVIILLFSVSALSADAYKDVSRMINNGYVRSDPERIRTLATELSQEQKKSLYIWNKVSIPEGVLFNSLLGFGSGSFKQGDTGHGIIFLCGDTICTGLIIFDILRVSGENFNAAVSGDGKATDELPFALAGLLGALALRIWQTIRPIQYAKNYNQKLDYSLNFDSPQIALVRTNDKLKAEIKISASISY